MGKVALFAVIAGLVAIFLKQIGSQFSNFVVLLTTVGLFAYILLEVTGIFQLFSGFQVYFSFEDVYMTTLFKMIGIACIGEFSGNICKDLGYSGIASQVEFIARLSMLSLTLPIVFTLLQTLEGLFIS